jgi:hypothetical protein
MHFGTKNYLKSNRYHTIKHPLNKLVSINRERERERERERDMWFFNQGSMAIVGLLNRRCTVIVMQRAAACN